MRDRKNTFKNVFVVAILSLLACSCSRDEISAEEFSKPNNLNESGFYCYISGKSVFYDSVTNEATTKIVSGSTESFIYNSSFALTSKSIKWSVVDAEPAGSIVINGNDNNRDVSITFASNFKKGTINATGTDQKGQICGPSLIITKP